MVVEEGVIKTLRVRALSCWMLDGKDAVALRGSNDHRGAALPPRDTKGERRTPDREDKLIVVVNGEGAPLCKVANPAAT